MALHEKMKNAKIAEEIFVYMLENGHHRVDLSMDMKEEETTFVLTLDKADEDFVKKFQKELYCCRDIELEEYGWDFTTEDHCVCQLDTIGMLIDSYDVETVNDQYRIVLHRKRR